MENNYKKTTDEYYDLYQAFRLSGFDRDQAFDLVLSLCTSTTFNDTMQRLHKQEINRLRHESREQKLKYLKEDES